MRRKYRLISEIEQDEPLVYDADLITDIRDDDEGGESGSGSGGIRIRGRIRDFSSIETTPLLIDDSEFMAAERRLLEQAGNRKIAQVEVRDHPEKNTDSYEQGAHLKQHPLLGHTQQLDGISETLAINPLNSEEAKRELQNQLRHQHQKKMEKQQQLSQAPTLRAG